MKKMPDNPIGPHNADAGPGAERNADEPRLFSASVSIGLFGSVALPTFRRSRFVTQDEPETRGPSAVAGLGGKRQAGPGFSFSARCRA